MRYLLIILLLGCAKEQQRPLPEVCNFPYPTTRQDDILSSTEYDDIYPAKDIKYLIYLEYKGTLINNPYWNGGIPFNTKQVITDSFTKVYLSYFANVYYSRWKVGFTTDSVYYRGFTGMKDKVHMVSNKIYENGVEKQLIGYASGVAFINGLYSDQINDAFVFPDVFPKTRYFKRDVGATLVHEAGHMAGLYHQSDYDANCVKINEYRYGCFMGNPFYPSKLGWTTGTSRGCNIFQNDSLTLDSKLTY